MVANAPESKKIKCPNCGTKNKDEALFCDNCGKPLKSNAPASESKKEAPTSGILENITLIIFYVICVFLVLAVLVIGSNNLLVIPQMVSLSIPGVIDVSAVRALNSWTSPIAIGAAIIIGLIAFYKIKYSSIAVLVVLLIIFWFLPNLISGAYALFQSGPAVALDCLLSSNSQSCELLGGGHKEHKL